MNKEPVVIDSMEPCWDYFGLSYAAYLVLPRVILCSAPVEWQKRFVAMMKELERMFPEQCGGQYTVHLREKGRFVADPLKNYRHQKLEPRKITPEEGDHCPQEGCNGTLVYQPAEDCSCHVNPPCQACLDVKLTCDECGWEYG